MAKVNLVGVQPLDFPSNDGSQVKGLSLQLNFPDENVMGMKADHKFISDMACKNLGIDLEDLEPLIGTVIEIETNLKGKITGIVPAV